MPKENYKIENNRKEQIESYYRRPQTVEAESKRELKVSKEYRGRELFELLQNADDATDINEGVLRITLKGNSLFIENNGNQPFSYKGIMSLMTADYSSKDPETTNVIGNKGLGFRSILSWSQKISIFSENISVSFCKENAIEMQNELIKKWGESYIDGCEDVDFEKTPIPILAAPKIEEVFEAPSKQMITRIKIVLKDNQIDNVRHQLSLLSGNELLFVNHLKKIEIFDEESTKFFTLDKSSSKIIGVIKKTDVKLTSADSFRDIEMYTYEDYIEYYDIDKEKNDKKKYKLGIAFTNENGLNDKWLYSYFETRIDNPFPFIINATLELTSDRNHLIPPDDLGFNKKVIDRLSSFIIDVVLMHNQKNDTTDYHILRHLILLKKKNFLASYGFYNSYIKNLKNAKILPSINGDYLNIIDDKPVYYEDEDFSSIFRNHEFTNLLKFTSESVIMEFFRDLDKNEITLGYDIKFFTDIINLYLDKYSKPQKALLIKHIIDFYGSKQSIYPNLLSDITGNDIVFGNKVYNSADEVIQRVPKWLPIKFLDNELKLELISVFDIKSEPLRTLSNQLSCFGLVEYNFLIILTLLEKEIEKDSITVSQIIEITQWLFQYYKNTPNVEFKIKMKAITKKGEINYTNKIYFHQEYKNGLGSKLLGKSKLVPFLAKPKDYGLHEEDPNALREFFINLGVNELPKRIWVELDTKQTSNYIKYHSNLQRKYGHFIRDDYYFNHTTSKLVTYEYLSEILEIASPIDVIEWLLSIDEKQLSKYETNANSEMKLGKSEKYFYYSEKYRVGFDSIKENLPSYFIYSLNQIRWIPVHGKKDKITPAMASLMPYDLSPYYDKPNVDFKGLKKLNDEWDENKIRSVLSKIGFKTSISDMEYSDIYKLLMALPTIDVQFINSTKIYEEMIKKYDKEPLDDLLEYKTFINEGKIVAKKNKTKSYQPVKNVYYADNRELCDTLLNETYIFDMRLRQGAGQINSLFGVNVLRDYDIDFVKQPIISKLQDDFKIEYKELIPYILVKRNQPKLAKTDLNNLANNQIELCDELSIKYAAIEDEEPKEYGLKYNDYVYVSKNRKGYIVSQKFTSILDAFNDIDFSDALAELISMILKVENIKDPCRELIGKRKEDRDKIIIRDHGDNGVTDLRNFQRELGIFKDNESLFWDTISALTKKKKGVILKSTQLSENFNYNQLSDEANVLSIIELFKKQAITIEQFNSFGELKINISQYHKRLFDQSISEYYEKYKIYLYNTLLSQPGIKRVETYNKLLNDFNFPAYDNYNFNVVSFRMTDAWESIFSVSLHDLDSQTTIILSEIEDSNFKCFMTSHPHLSDQIKKYDLNELKLYALFNEIDSIIVEQTPQKQQTTIPDENKKKTYNDIIKYEEISKIALSANIDAEKISTVSVDGNKRSSESTKGTGNKGVFLSEKEKLTRGYLAEYYVYKKLVEKFTKGKVRWVSKNAEHAGITDSGNDTLHYDMTYKDENNNQHYVEVKSISERINFDITKGEADFALQPGITENYDVHIVKIKEMQILAYYEIPKIFVFEPGQSFMNNAKFSISNKDFSIVCKIIKP